MATIYETCPQFENENDLLRFVEREDAEDLLEVYSDKNALPFYNSGNCDGDNFYYPTMEKMEQAIHFWRTAYQEKWFVRWAIIDKRASKAIGTIKMFHRISNDPFHDMGVLRLMVL